MTETIITNELTIWLQASSQTSADIQQLRRRLEPSPYRDDKPHLTLLRGIRAPAAMSDPVLLTLMSQLLAAPEHLPLVARVKKIGNYNNRHYSSSSAVVLSVSPEVRKWRKQILFELRQAGFRSEAIARLIFVPHLTIRLGVPVSGDSLQTAQQVFPKDGTLIFDNWRLFRIAKQGNKRSMQLVGPNG